MNFQICDNVSYSDSSAGESSAKTPSPDGDTSDSVKCSYSLKRSKSVCDFGANAIVQPAKVAADGPNAVDGSNGDNGGQKVSKVVRNRTILGSFPLFFKLSQSLSSLNSADCSRDSTLCTR